MTMATNDKRCKDCAEYVETGHWYVNGRLEPYGRCMRRFNMYAKKPYGYDLDWLARVRWNGTCYNHKPKQSEL